jgi:hypothetical protein
MTTFLLVNLCDLDYLRMPVFGNALTLMIREDLGDRLLPGAWIRESGKVDEMYVIVEATAERAEAIAGGLEVIGKRKMGRRVRTETRAKVPTGKGWRHVPEGEQRGESTVR